MLHMVGFQGRRETSREGDERLSGKNHGSTGKRDEADALHASSTQKDAPARKDKASPVGRALRTVYDDMLRETVPDDFLELLKKLD